MAICHPTYDWFLGPPSIHTGFAEPRHQISLFRALRRRRALIICITLHRRSGTGLSEESQEARLLLGKMLRKMQILYTPFLGLMFRPLLCFQGPTKLSVIEKLFLRRKWVFLSWKKSTDCGVTLGSCYAKEKNLTMC